MKLKRGEERPRRSLSSRPRASLNYYRSKPSTTSPAKPSRRLSWRRLFRRSGETVILLSVVVVILYSLIISPSPEVKLNSELYHSTRQYQASLQNIMGSFWDRNKITFDKSGLTSKLQHQYPEVTSVQTRLPLIGHRPQVTVEVAMPSFRLLSGKQSYLVSQQGIAITNQVDAQFIKNLPAVEDQSGFAIQVGKPALDSAAVSFINTMLAELKRAKVPVKSLSLPQAAQQVDLRTKDHGYYTKFYLGGNVLIETGQYLAARHNFDKSGRHPSQYLDVRVEGKLFYR